MDSPDNVNPRLVEADIAPSPSANVETTGEQAKPGADQIADAGTDSMASPTVGDVEAAPGTQPSNNVEPTDEPTPLVRPLRSLLVVDVQLTEAGRASDAFVATLQQAGIRVGEERKVDAELASTVADEDEDSQAFSEEAELMLLEAPTKKLANLGDLLATNRNAFRSVRLSLVVDAPVLKAIESVRIDDPKKIQHGGQSIPLVTRQPDLFQEFGKTLVRGPFAPLDSTTSQMIGSPSPSEDGPNPMSQLLILIR
jgi:hypothetical protein